MNDLTTELSRDQETLLLTMAHHYMTKGTWPVWDYVVHTMDRQDLDAHELIRSLPRVGSTGLAGSSYGLTTPPGHHIADDARLGLTVAAALHLGELWPHFAAPFLNVLHHLIAMRRSRPVSGDGVTEVSYTAADLKNAMPSLRDDFLVQLPGILSGEPATWGGNGSTSDTGIWKRSLNREIRRWRDAKTLQEYVATTVEVVNEDVQQVPQGLAFLGSRAATVPAAPEPTRPVYIDEALIQELEELETDWSLDKLVALLRELNSNYADGHPYSCQALLRAVLDHIPPAFGKYERFGQVVSNHKWSHTDAAYAKKLSETRNTGDDVLHRLMRRSPSRIDMNDVPPRAWINALLQELLVVLAP